MNFDVAVIGAASSAGAYAPGQEKAPDCFRHHGLIASLERSGLRVVDCGNAASFRWRPDPQRPKAMNLDAVADVARAVRGSVAKAFEKAARLLLLGGDCTVELGTVAGALQRFDSIGLIYIDLDTDLHAPETSDGALDWTGVAHLLDIPGAAGELGQMGGRKPMLRPHEILFVAAGEITPPEAKTIEELGLEVVSLAALKRDGPGALARILDWAASFDCLLVHADADVLEYVHCPIAENVRRAPGLRLAELSELLRQLAMAPNFKALTLTEVNPDHAPDTAAAFGDLINMLSDVMRSACQAPRGVS